jgi:hypothetical protein
MEKNLDRLVDDREELLLLNSMRCAKDEAEFAKIANQVIHCFLQLPQSSHGQEAAAPLEQA